MSSIAKVLVHQNWFANLVEKRNTWFGRQSGRRIEEELDRVRLFEREILVVEVWVKNGNIENAKAAAIGFALDRDSTGGPVATEPWFLE